ncbi:hypothetical protein GCM10025882_01430 [Acinetobacter gyllenbergii]|uniref:Lipoprotein n=1 Tax=Acinetobacter gyllenbergii CIP 110306 = MTCC 11365 TaxID=1217657 RepID=A0A829HDM3_9GAMM|nr:hypothetical protein [Acinetobacter gyllenbergii]EPF74731.1 hypothetical protein F957_03335 [Acinetobacter gyllenbergii CIP 110306 = MTCC 11365]EPH31832.1 hypothetical protein L293_2025 [Acinetobacter gyllenbergii CIP 110306 = MTCC 11365]GMA09719.1 hypothetical protein GCM10025882_01430 [Acinetobacter gyllenbergii]
MQSKILLLAPLFIMSVGCTVTKTPEGKSIGMLPIKSAPKHERYLNIDSSASKADKIQMYRDQLIEKFPNQDFTFIRTFPYRAYQSYDSFTPRPYMINTIDGHQVKVPEFIMFRSKNVLLTELAQQDLKVPVGVHDLVIINGFKSTSYYTEIKNVNFEKNKNYVMGADYSKETGSRLYIAEYEIDQRFKTNEPESIVIKKKIVEGIEQGNLKYVKIY